jgi:hypothetical protein
LEMTKIATLKAQASNLKSAMAEMGIALTQSQALEAIAKQYGVANWDTMSGLLKRESFRSPTLADMPGVPDSAWVEKGTRSTLCLVSDYDSEALALLHDVQALEAYFEKFSDQYEDGMDTCAIFLQGDGRNYEFTFADLQGLTYKKLGGQGNWLLASGDTYLRFNCGSVWSPEEQIQDDKVQLAVPTAVKSAKGCQLLVLTSHDGAQYDRHAIVPPHLNAEQISKRVAEELVRLKDLDRLKEETADYDGYTEVDVARFVSSLGCLWIGTNEQVIVSQTWD